MNRTVTQRHRPPSVYRRQAIRWYLHDILTSMGTATLYNQQVTIMHRNELGKEEPTGETRRVGMAEAIGGLAQEDRLRLLAAAAEAANNGVLKCQCGHCGNRWPK